MVKQVKNLDLSNFFSNFAALTNQRTKHYLKSEHYGISYQSASKRIS